jgi:hypothetical protein
MPKIALGSLSLAKISQKTNIQGWVPPTPPSGETNYIVTNNSEPLETDTGDNLIYGT